MKCLNVICQPVRGALMAVASILMVPAAMAEDYVLTAGTWGDTQTETVQAAGGDIVWSHQRSGIGVASSDDPAFLSRITASNAFTAVSPDMEVQWQPGIQSGEMFALEDITPGDEIFFALQWNMQAMNAPAAWDTGCTGAGARVAVVDGGIYDIHSDLEPNLDKSCSTSFVSGEPYNTDLGTFWHGTHVAGIVAAADNGSGVIGVAPEATLMGVKVAHGGSGTFSAVIAGILYASDPAAFGASDCQRADIINLSLGELIRKRDEGAGRLVGALGKAVNFAASQDVLVVSAAGNNGVDLRELPGFTFVPADSGSGLSVSATGPVNFANGGTNFRRPASYSNFGRGSVDLAAPGGDVVLGPPAPGEPPLDPNWFFDLVFSNCRGAVPPPIFFNCFAGGTSMAASAASGVAALIVGQNPGIPLGALKSKLAQTADDEGAVGRDGFYGHGFVNAFRACTE